jgi:hypothetical protein
MKVLKKFFNKTLPIIIELTWVWGGYGTREEHDLEKNVNVRPLFKRTKHLVLGEMMVGGGERMPKKISKGSGSREWETLRGGTEDACRVDVKNWDGCRAGREIGA